jgi:hypothetical protein
MGTARDPSVNVGSGDPLSTSTGGRENHFIFASILENRGCYISMGQHHIVIPVR